MKPDVLVLGAGMIGTCTALQLALRGHSVALLDRREPGRETSYGNAGLIQCEAVEPYPFPQDPAMLLRVALKRGADVNYHLGAMPSLASPLGQYWANSRGARVKMVGMVFDKTPMTFFSHADKPLLKPKDLEGKTVAAPAGDSQRLAFPAFARLNQIDPAKVTWVNIEPTAKVASIAEKRVDGVADYTTGQPFYDKAMGPGKAVRLQWADYGFDLYAMSIIAGEKTMAEKPQQLKAFLEASYMGWRDVMANPKEALAIFKKRVPEIDVAIMVSNALSEPQAMVCETLTRSRNRVFAMPMP